MEAPPITNYTGAGLIAVGIVMRAMELELGRGATVQALVAANLVEPFHPHRPTHSMWMALIQGVIEGGLSYGAKAYRIGGYLLDEHLAKQDPYKGTPMEGTCASTPEERDAWVCDTLARWFCHWPDPRRGVILS